jgi:hypothetical protein
MATKTKSLRLPANRLTSAKRRALRILAEYFCIRTNDAATLLKGRQPTQHDKRTIRRTLHLLYKSGHANRLQYFDVITTDRGAMTYVYGLSDKGMKVLEPNDIWNSDFAKSFDEHSERTLDHELEITAFHMALKRFCVSHGLELSWVQCDLKKKTIAPDAYFAITDPRQPHGKNTLHYFLEVERAKIGNFKNGESSIIRKLGKYYDYYDTDQCEKDWYAFRKFRVILTLRNDERRANLLKELEEKYKNRMFWLTTEPAYKENIGGEIFQTPKDYEQRSYSFLSQ